MNREQVRDAERGQSLVEFALVLPVLILLLMGIVDFGRILSIHELISVAARDGARYASIDDTDIQVQTAIQSDTALIGNAMTWSISPSPTRNSGEATTVTVSYTVQIFDPLMAAFVGSHYTVSSAVTMRVE